MTEPLLTHKEKRTLLKAGLGLGAIIWAGPQVIAVGFLALGLVVAAGLLLFVAVGAVLKYLAIGAAILLVLGLVFGFGRRRSPTIDGVQADYDANERAARAALDVELAKAVRDAEAKKTAGA